MPLTQPLAGIGNRVTNIAGRQHRQDQASHLSPRLFEFIPPQAGESGRFLQALPGLSANNDGVRSTLLTLFYIAHDGMPSDANCGAVANPTWHK